MWQHNVYYVCVTLSVVRYVGIWKDYVCQFCFILKTKGGPG